MYKPLVLVAFGLSIALSTPAVADYQAAEAALQSGDLARAIPLLEDEAQRGNPVASYNLGKLYETGALGQPDYEKAATWYRQGAEIGTTKAMFDGNQLGPQGADLIFAAQLYSQYGLARLYETGKGVPQDVAEAVRWYKRAADQDLDLAQLQLVKIYRQGAGSAVPRDLALAAQWLTRLAERGNLAAMNDLGKAYLQGQGVTKNAKTAHDWLEKAATLGSAAATYNLGLLYQAGYSGQPDYVRAAEQFARGADRKDPRSMSALGDLYAHGLGVPQSNLQAHVWYDLAVRFGLTEAAERRAAIAQSLTSAEVGTARAMADSWRPRNQLALPIPTSTPETAPAAEAPPPVTATEPAAPAPEPLSAVPAEVAPAEAVPAPPPVSPDPPGAVTYSHAHDGGPVHTHTYVPGTPATAAPAETAPAEIAPAEVPPATVASPAPQPTPAEPEVLQPYLPAPTAPAEPIAAPSEPAAAPAANLVGTPQPGAKPFGVEDGASFTAQPPAAPAVQQPAAPQPGIPQPASDGGESIIVIPAQ